jgi:TPR repeat protein
LREFLDYFLERGCELGDTRSCLSHGNLLCTGAQGAVQQDERRCLQIYERVCEQGDQHACWSVGNLYAHGSRVPDAFPADRQRAFEVYQRACRKGEAAACASLADCYQEGAGVKRDLKRANQYRWMAEELGYEGC